MGAFSLCLKWKWNGKHQKFTVLSIAHYGRLPTLQGHKKPAKELIKWNYSTNLAIKLHSRNNYNFLKSWNKCLSIDFFIIWIKILSVVNSFHKNFNVIDSDCQCKAIKTKLGTRYIFLQSWNKKIPLGTKGALLYRLFHYGMCVLRR